MRAASSEHEGVISKTICQQYPEKHLLNFSDHKAIVNLQDVAAISWKAINVMQKM